MATLRASFKLSNGIQVIGTCNYGKRWVFQFKDAFDTQLEMASVASRAGVSPAQLQSALSAKLSSARNYHMGRAMQNDWDKMLATLPPEMSAVLQAFLK